MTLKWPQLHFETFYNHFSGQYETTDHNWSTIGPIRIAKPFEPPQLNIPRSYKKQIKIKNGQKLHLKIGFSASNESQLGCLLVTSGRTYGETFLLNVGTPLLQCHWKKDESEVANHVQGNFCKKFHLNANPRN